MMPPDRGRALYREPVQGFGGQRAKKGFLKDGLPLRWVLNELGGKNRGFRCHFSGFAERGSAFLFPQMAKKGSHPARMALCVRFRGVTRGGFRRKTGRIKIV
jgi:hypothetical protein